MAVPKRKVSKSKRGMRSANKSIDVPSVISDNKTGDFWLPHQVSYYGMYKGKKYVSKKTNKPVL